MKMLNESLQKENQAREREIRRLNKDLQKYEQSVNKREELSKSCRPCQQVPTKDAEVMAGMCCTGTEMAVLASPEVQPPPPPPPPTRDQDDWQQRIESMEAALKLNQNKVHELRKANVTLNQEVQFVQQLCALLDDNNRKLTTSVKLRDDIIKEMRRQLSYHKHKIASMSTQMPGTSREEGTSVCIVESPRQKPILIPESPVSMFSSPRPKSVSYPPESEGLHRLHLYPGTNTYSPRSRSSKGVIASESQIDEGSPRLHRCANEEYVDNVETTARVLRASVCEAEARCRELATRNAQLVEERARAERQIQKLRRALRDSNAAVKMEPSVSVSTEPEHRKSQKDVVVAVQSKLSIIEDLYRNCFYETVRQDAVIELLRKALTEVRETEKVRMKGTTRSPWGSKHGSDKGVRQQWDTDACHNILADVDNLKIEISNYISNSNNDSGMWERGGGSEASSQGGGVTDELHGILTQLSQLRLLLTDDFGSCGCSDNQITLKKENEDLRAEAACLQCKIKQLESSMSEKEKLLLRYEQVIEGHSHELTKVRQKLAQAGDRAKEWEANCQRKHAEIQNLNAKIQELQDLLDTKSGALEDAQARCKALEDSIQGLKEQLEDSAQQSSTVRGAARGVAEAARCGAERARAAAQQFRRLQHAHNMLQEKYRARLHESRSLGAQVRAAQRAGAALSSRARAALADMREHAATLQANHRMQEAIIKSKDQQIQRLREQLRNQSDSERTSVNEMPCCSKSMSDEDRKCASAREAASRHTPPPPCGDDRCPYWRCCERGSSSVPLAHRRSASLCRRPDTCCLNASVHAQFSPTVPLIEGMSQLQEALASSQRRWQRRDAHPRR